MRFRNLIQFNSNIIMIILFSSTCSIATASDVEILIQIQRQPGTSQITNERINYNSKSIEFIIEPKQSQEFPLFQWMLGLGSGSKEKSEIDLGPNYNTRLFVQPGGYFTTGIRLLTPGTFNIGFGADIRIRTDGLRGGSYYQKKRQDDVEGLALLLGKYTITPKNSPLKILIGGHYGHILTKYPYPDREFAIFSGVKF